VSFANAIPQSVILARGHSGVTLRWSLVSVVTNVVLTIALTPPFGLVGVITGTVIGSLISQVYGLWDFRRRESVPMRTSVAALLKPSLVALGCALPVFWAASAAAGATPRLLGAGLLVLLLVCFTVAYALVGRVLGLNVIAGIKRTDARLSG